MAEMFGCAPSPVALARMTRKIAEIIAPSREAFVKALVRAKVAHFDETGFRVARELAWVHSPSSGNSRWSPCSLSAAPRAWTPPGHCRVRQDRLPRRLEALRRRRRARSVQCSSALGADRRHRDRHRRRRDLGAAGNRRAAGTEARLGRRPRRRTPRHRRGSPGKRGRWFRHAAATGLALNAARRSKLQRKRHALAARMRDRRDDYLRFAHYLRIPSTTTKPSRS